MISNILALLFLLAVLGWVAWKLYENSDDTLGWFISKTMLTCVGIGSIIWSGITMGIFAVPFTLFICIILTWFWAPNIGSILAGPFSSIYSAGAPDDRPSPLYSIAQAKVKQGKYTEAITEIRKQLAEFPNDFEGHFMMADIQANKLHQLDDAEDTLEKTLGLDGMTSNKTVAVLNQLADWKLKITKDVDAARGALNRIVELFPNTEFSMMAQQRIAHLADKAFLEDKENPHSLKLLHHDVHLGVTSENAVVESLKQSAHDKAKSHAAELVAQLERHPNDYETRERLANLYGEEFGRPDLAILQMDYLLGLEQAPSKKKVAWMNMVADYYVRKGDLDGAKNALKKVIDAYPETAHATLARTRMSYLKLSVKGNEAAEPVKLVKSARKLGLDPL